ncbi:hypothetical protein PRZ48_004964 [Zasmidium cellare]|uniref:Uncharacterized protein n=1 Tax=Zasmidium cellare TaxID=395010 RepID=A0ABR0ER19_ZASCE|nr:hypothetical protein PRZ48_004964 [Zasmidium cellare]
MDEYFEPEWQLFLVNRLVRKEAMQVFFENNQIVVNDYPKCPLILKRTRAVGEVQALSSLSPEHLTSLSVSFDPRGLCGPYENPILYAEDLRRLQLISTPNTSWATLTEQDRVQHAHDWLSSNMCVSWKHILVHATGTQPELPSALRELQIDVTNCYCRQGCCRVVNSPAWSLAQCRFGKSLKKIEIVGTKTRAERDMFVDALLGSAEDSLAVCQPKLVFKAFDLESRSNELRTLDWDGLDPHLQLGDEEVDLGSRWEQHLLDTAGG